MTGEAQDRPPVGFIGLGVMGLPMADNLLRAGHPLIVNTRTRSRADRLVTAGARWAATPAEVAAASEFVFTMLPDSPDVLAVATGDDGIFASSGHPVWVDCSSIAPAVARNLADEAARRGIEALDAPVSGGEIGAIEATLSIMVGGSHGTFQRCEPLLACLGRSIVRVGDHGAGQLAKVCNQIVVGCTIAAVAEALVLASKAGVDPAAVREVLLGGLAQSKILDVHGGRMLQRTFAPGFRTELHRKDLTNALLTGQAAGASVPLTAAVAELMSAQMANGRGGLDHSALVTVYESLAGLSPDE